MTAMSVDSLGTLGGALNNYSPVVDATTDLDAGAGNKAMADIAAMTHCCPRAWTRFTPAGTGAPVLTAHDEMWGAVGLAAPIVARTTTGIYTLTWPSNVQDEIPSGSPGYTGPQPLNLRMATGNSEGGTTYFDAKPVVTSPNVVTVYIWNGASTPALVDPTGTTFGVVAY
jgi:hypothetical protein